LGRINEFKKGKGSGKSKEALTVLKDSSWQNLLSVRNGKGIKESLKTIQEIKTGMVPHFSVETPLDLVQALELDNLLLDGEMIARTGLMRTESRGTHYREDFPAQDDSKWVKCITVKNVNGEMQLGTVVVDKDWKSDAEDMGGKWWA
jgi:succinate dehydrogenase/fumarate reductase flavoprotein subunit